MMLFNRSAPHDLIVPVLIVSDVRAAVSWYGTVFGFVEHVRVGEGHRAQLGIEGAELIVAESRPGRRLPAHGRSNQVMIKVDDVATVLDRAVAAGATVTDELHDWEYGERQAMIEDVFGHEWVLTQTLHDIAPETWSGTTVTPRQAKSAAS